MKSTPLRILNLLIMIFLMMSLVFPVNVDPADSSSEGSIPGWTVLGEYPGMYYFINRTFGWAVDYPSKLFKTINGGETWNIQNSSLDLGPADISDIYFWNDSHGWITGWNGIAGTMDGGKTWVLLATYYRVGNLVFANSSHGWALQEYKEYGSEKIYHTTNGGFNWTELPSPTNYYLNDLTFINDTWGWIVGDAGIILHTTDGGLSWHSQESNVMFDLTTVQFLDVNHGYIGIGTSIDYFEPSTPTILKTSDGKSWAPKTFNVSSYDSSLYSNNIETMFFLSVTDGWAIVHHRLWRTMDGGENWREWPSRDDLSKAGIGFRGPYRIFFVDEEVGWVGIGGKLLRTTSGGLGTTTTTTVPTTYTTPGSSWLLSLFGLLLLGVAAPYVYSRRKLASEIKNKVDAYILLQQKLED